MQGSRRQQRAFALVAGVLWLLGVEVLPNLHLAFHHDDHTHEANGTIASFEARHHHEHDEDHEHEHGHARGADDHHAPREAGSNELALEHPQSEHHRAGGVSHHAIALHQSPPQLLAPIEVARTVWRLDPLVDELPRSAGVSHPTSRGPPAI